MSDELPEGEKFFKEQGYYYTKFVPRKKSSPNANNWFFRA